jgi:hypothetical protein
VRRSEEQYTPSSFPLKSHPLSDVPQSWLDHKHHRVSYCIPGSYKAVGRNLESGKPRRSLNFPSLRRMTGLASRTIITPSCPQLRVFTCAMGRDAHVYMFSALPPVRMDSCRECCNSLPYRPPYPARMAWKWINCLLILCSSLLGGSSRSNK